LAFRGIGPCRRFWPFGPPGARLDCPVRLPIRLRHAVSALGLARSAPVCSSPAGVPSGRGSAGRPCAAVVAAGKRHPFAPCAFPVFALPWSAGLPKSAGFQAGPVQAFPGLVEGRVWPRRPVRLRCGNRAGPPAFVFGPAGVRHRRPFLGPTRRSRGRGLCIWLRRRHFPPRPLARALGTFKKEQVRVGRAGPPGNFGPQLFRPVWQGCRLAFRGIGPCRRFWLFGPTAGVA